MDILFILDIVLNFFLKVKMIDNKTGIPYYLRTRGAIARNYMRLWSRRVHLAQCFRVY